MKQGGKKYKLFKLKSKILIEVYLHKQTYPTQTSPNLRSNHIFQTKRYPQILINLKKSVRCDYYMKASALVLILALAVLIVTDTLSAASIAGSGNKARSANQSQNKLLKDDAAKNKSSQKSSQNSEKSLNYHRLPAKNERNQNNIYEFVDHAIKDKYWYYLTKANLLYLTSVEQGNNSFQFLAIYRNIVGTFLSITSWTKGASIFQVNTLVRLGDGDGMKFGAKYKPVDIRPIQLRYSLGANEIILEYTDSWDIRINGKCIECEENEVTSEDLILKQCKELDSLVQNKFWYYLDHARVIYSNFAKTSSRNYCLINYLNEVGLFLVIGSRSQSEQAADNQINTFVRLGNSFASGVQYKQVSFNKVKLPLSDFSD